MIILTGGVATRGHADDPDDRQSRHHEEPQDRGEPQRPKSVVPPHP